MKGLRCIFSLANLQIFVFVYAAIKYTLKIQKTDWIFAKIAAFLLRLLLTLLVSILVFVFLLIFAIYHEMVNIILKWRHGRDYAEMFEGTDAIWAIEDESKIVLFSLYLIEVKEGEDDRDVYKFFSESYSDVCVTHPKLGCVRKNYLGYNYYLKTKIDIANFVKDMDGYVDEASLQPLLDKYCNLDFPMDNCAMWDIHVGRTPINWKGHTKKNIYPVFTRYHHTLGDAVTFLAIAMTNLASGGVQIMKDQCETYKAMMNKTRKRTGFVDKVKAACTKEFYFKYSGFVVPKEYNILHGRKLSGEKFFCWTLEQENDKYIDKVKAIKNRFRRVTFTDVMLTVLSASVAEYFMKHDQNPPKTIRVAITQDFSSPEINEKITYKNGSPTAILSNKLSAAVVTLPIEDEAIEENLISRLNTIRKDTELLQKSLDFYLTFWLLKVSSVIPRPLVRRLFKSNDMTLAMSNVLGIKRIDLLNGHVIRDFIAGGPNFSPEGLSFGVFSYDNLFKITALVDKALISNREDVNGILDNIFKYIDRLEILTRNNVT